MQNLKTCNVCSCGGRGWGKAGPSGAGAPPPQSLDFVLCEMEAFHQLPKQLPGDFLKESLTFWGLRHMR